jgi:transmembrane protein DUF3566
VKSGDGLGSAERSEDGTDNVPPLLARIRRSRRRRAGRRRARGVVRKIDTFSVFRVSVFFYFALYCILLVAGAILWAAASATGLRGNVESFIADLIASGKFEFVGGELFRAAAFGGAVLVVLGAAANVLLAVLYNLISEVVGGISLVVEELPIRTAPAEPAPAAADATPGSAPPPAPIVVPEAELKRPRRSPERAPSVVRQTPS